MPERDVWVGSWRPHKPRGPISAHYTSPGPKYALPGSTGTVFHDPRKSKGPAFSFGTRNRPISSDCSPGPKYLIPSKMTRRGLNKSPAHSLTGPPKDPTPSLTPGPGKYCPQMKNTSPSAPAYSLSARTKEVRKDQTPGPAAYMLPPVLGPKTVTKTSSPSCSLVGRSKNGNFYEDLQKTPGPAAYGGMLTCNLKSTPPSYSICGRNLMPGDTTKKPGPGAHRPEQVSLTKRKAPSFSFGVLHSEFLVPHMNVAV